MISPASFSDTPESPSSTGRRQAFSNPETAHDAELVRRFHAGEDAAFSEIVTRHRGKMFAVALSLLRNHADAEEIAQDTFVRAYRGLVRFRGDSSLVCWLHRITLNLARNRYWYFHRRHRHDTQSFDCTLNEGNRATFGDLIASDLPSPVQETTNREFCAQVAICMGRLSPPQREILALRNQADRSYEEIAATLGLTLGTVKSRIGRARKNLHGLLAKAYARPEAEASPACEWFESNRPSAQFNWAVG